jgi:hypothetical protein
VGEPVSEFIFMLTRDDETVSEARAIYRSVAESGVTHFGCKDIGLPRAELEELLEEIRADGHTSYLEVVSETEQATLQSARVAAEIRPDYLIGGTLIEPVLEIIDGTGIRFFPYVGQIVGHPCLLRGSIDKITADAREAERLGVDGLNLLAYRFDRDVDALVEAVIEATSLPVIAAGSVDSTARIAALSRRGVWGFTVGTAALDGEFVPGQPLGAQLAVILDAASQAAVAGRSGRDRDTRD